MKKAVLLVVGTRPEVIKMGPVFDALSQSDDFRPILVNTGQHREMARQTLDFLDISPTHDLSVGQPRASLSELLSKSLSGVGQIIDQEKPDFVLVQGDTVSTLAGALASFYQNTPVGHVEAGLRTWTLDSPFPEEGHRQVISRLSSLHFAPTAQSKANLQSEGIDTDRIEVTGNTGIDALKSASQKISNNPILAIKLREGLSQHLGSDWLDSPYLLVTMHRRENLGPILGEILEGLAEFLQRQRDVSAIFPMHLNPAVRNTVEREVGENPRVHLLPPTSYGEMILLLKHSWAILSDSGGVQEEGVALGKRVLVPRKSTERVEGVFCGGIQLVGTTKSDVLGGLSSLGRETPESSRPSLSPFGDGEAATRILARLAREL